MPGINIVREHTLGLAEARRLADHWVRQAEQDYAMSCEVVRGDAGDTVQFSRSGVSGALEVRADCFELTARLGFLLGAFSQKIEREIARNLDSLLEAAGEPTGVLASRSPVKPPEEGAGPFPSSSGTSTRGKPRKTG